MTRHEFTGRPSTSTIHAPQRPISQERFVPVSSKSSRMTFKSRREGGISVDIALPLRLQLKVNLSSAKASSDDKGQGYLHLDWDLNYGSTWMFTTFCGINGVDCSHSGSMGSLVTRFPTA